MCPSVSIRRANTAFTLIEVLVVLAVVGILLAVSLPALAGARDSARSLRCASNIRNVGLAITSYAMEYGDFFPNAGAHLRRIDLPDEAGRVAVGGPWGGKHGGWAALFPEHWQAGQWDRALRCASQRDFDPSAPRPPVLPLTYESFRLPLFWLSAALWLDGQTLAPGARFEQYRVRAARQSDVLFPSRKVLAWEQIPLCVRGRGADFEKFYLGWSLDLPAAVARADGSAVRVRRAGGLPAARGLPFDETIGGVRGVDLP